MSLDSPPLEKEKERNVLLVLFYLELSIKMPFDKKLVVIWPEGKGEEKNPLSYI